MLCVHKRPNCWSQLLVVFFRSRKVSYILCRKQREEGDFWPCADRLLLPSVGVVSEVDWLASFTAAGVFWTKAMPLWMVVESNILRSRAISGGRGQQWRCEVSEVECFWGIHSD